MRQLIYGIFFCLLFLPVFCMAQVTVVFVPEVQGRTLDGLFMARLSNPSSSKQRVSLKVTVAAQPGLQVVVIKTPPFDLLPGVNPFPAGLMTGASLQFGNNKVADLCRQSGYFAAGDYEYCYEITAHDGHSNGAVLGQQCFNYFLQPFSPLILSSPNDGDRICDKRPTFFWQPLLPALPGMQYRLILTDLKTGQSKAEALRYNMPLINQSFINMPMLFFPPSAKELTEGNEYVWQVTAYRGDVLLASSEMWAFRLQCTDSSAAVTPESFRDIEDLVKGNFYLARGAVRFAVYNVYAAVNLNYSINCITDPEKKVKKLPHVRLQNGNNHVIIDISENSSFVDGYYYQLSLRLPDGGMKQLRFLYKKEDN
ncbi:hypothetical protein ACDQ55_21160 [Chitinophaga sp. 30R24]|uniref:hypothetical protein n=1 Tax=Chitinophaga sp. 30R24 TaxID=3248838 RepID=UPI003B90F115